MNFVRVLIAVCIFCAVLRSDAHTHTQNREYWYHFSEHGKKTGYVHEKVTGPDSYSGRMHFTYTFVIKNETGLNTTAVTILTENNKFLSPLKITVKTSVNGDVHGFAARFTDNRAEAVSIAGPVLKKIFDVPRDTIPWPGIFELLRRTCGREIPAFIFTSLEVPDLSFKRKSILVSGDTECMVINSRAYEARRYIHEGLGMSPLYYWVNTDGSLLRVLIDGSKELVRASEAEARDMSRSVSVSAHRSMPVIEKWYRVSMDTNNFGYCRVAQRPLAGPAAYRLFDVQYRLVVPQKGIKDITMRVLTADDELYSLVDAAYSLVINGAVVEKNAVSVHGCTLSITDLSGKKEQRTLPHTITSTALITVLADKLAADESKKTVYRMIGPTGPVIGSAAFVRTGSTRIIRNRVPVDVHVYSFNVDGSGRFYVSKSLGMVKYVSDKTLNLTLTDKADALELYRGLVKLWGDK